MIWIKTAALAPLGPDAPAPGVYPSRGSRREPFFVKHCRPWRT